MTITRNSRRTKSSRRKRRRRTRRRRTRRRRTRRRRTTRMRMMTRTTMTMTRMRMMRTTTMRTAMMMTFLCRSQTLFICHLCILGRNKVNSYPCYFSIYKLCFIKSLNKIVETHARWLSSRMDLYFFFNFEKCRSQGLAAITASLYKVIDVVSKLGTLFHTSTSLHLNFFGSLAIRKPCFGFWNGKAADFRHTLVNFNQWGT